MKRSTLIGVAVAIACLVFATPAAAQSWGLGPQVMSMAQDGVLGRDLAYRAQQLRYQQFLQNQQYRQFAPGTTNPFPYDRFRQTYPGTTNPLPTNRFGQTNQGFPPGKAWGLRGGKPYTGNGHPLNGLPNGRAFQDPATIQNGVNSQNGNRYRTFRDSPHKDRVRRSFRRRGRGRAK
jgi:type II secretory pathway pseudopilin PulG